MSIENNYSGQNGQNVSFKSLVTAMIPMHKQYEIIWWMHIAHVLISYLDGKFNAFIHGLHHFGMSKYVGCWKSAYSFVCLHSAHNHLEQNCFILFLVCNRFIQFNVVL